MQTFWTVANRFCYEKVIEKSKFIANIKRIEAEREGREFIAQIERAHPFATHNCYAMIADKAGQIQRFSDDGEPQGTAGLPMLEVLKNKKIYQSIVVVTRYFGGVKLGAGGLVRAYASTVAEALTEDRLCKCIQSQIVEFCIGYENFSQFKSYLQQQNCILLQLEYQDIISVKVAIPLLEFTKIINKLNNLAMGKLKYKLKEVDYIPYSQNKE